MTAMSLIEAVRVLLSLLRGVREILSNLKRYIKLDPYQFVHEILNCTGFYS